MTQAQEIRGAGGGSSKSESGGSRPPKIAKDTLIAVSTARIVELLGEGEIEGLVDGAASVFFDNTVLERTRFYLNNGSAAYNAGGDLTRLTTSAAHGLSKGDVVVISGTTNYEGEFELETGTAGSYLFIKENYVAESFDGTEVVSAVNFHGVTWEQRYGTPDQTAIQGFTSIESEIAVNVEITSAASSSRTVTNLEVDDVRVKIAIPALYKVDTSTGDVLKYQVKFAIDVQPDGGAWAEVFRPTIRGKCSSTFQRAYRIVNLAGYGTGPWTIRVRRLSVDYSPPDEVGETWWSSYTEIINEKLQYRDSAIMGLTVDASLFGSNIPVRSYKVRGLHIKYPSNYNPTTRVYTGLWNGTFTTGYCDNPAWVLYDLLTNTRYGAAIGTTYIDSAALYTIGQYCDAWVSDGNRLSTLDIGPAVDKGSGLVGLPSTAHGTADGTRVYITGTTNYDGSYIMDAASGTDEIVIPATYIAETFDGSETVDGAEPRFVVGGCINTRQEVYTVIMLLAAAFRGMVYWAASQVGFSQDAPLDPTRLVTAANVEDGDFNYETTSLRARHTAALVSWNDPADLGKLAVELVEDPTGIQEIGWNPANLSLWGCTSRGQANRFGRWLLYTERLETESLHYRAGWDHVDVMPGEVIKQHDPHYATVRFGGRLNQGTLYTVVLDAGVTLVGGVTYTLSIVLPNGTIESKTVAKGYSLTSILHDGFVGASATELAKWVEQHDVTVPTTLVADVAGAIGNVIRVGDNAGDDGAIKTWATSFAYDPAKLYRIRFRARNAAGTGQAYFGVAGRNALDTAWVNKDGADLVSGQYWCAGAGVTPTDVWTEYQGYFSGHTDPGTIVASPLPTAPCSLHTNATKFRPIFTCNWATSAGTFELDEVSVDEVTESGLRTLLYWSAVLSTPPQNHAIWVLDGAADEARQFRVVGKQETAPGKFQVVAISHDPAKYALVESGMFLDDFEARRVPEGALPVPTALAVSLLRFAEGNTRGTRAHVSWTHVVDSRVLSYEVEWRYTDVVTTVLSDWESAGETVVNSLIMPLQWYGTYDFRVRAVSKLAHSEWVHVFGTVFEATAAPPDVTGLQVLGGGTTFSGKHCELEWTAITGSLSAHLAYYKVVILTVGDVVKRTELEIRDARYTYTFEKNSEDFAGAPSRTFKVRVSAIDIYGIESATPTTITVANPAPSMDKQSPTITAKYVSIDLDWGSIFPSDPDLSQFAVYCDTVADPTGTLVYMSSAQGRMVSVPWLVAGTTYYLCVIPYDVFGVGLSSNVVSAVPLDIGDIVLDPTILQFKPTDSLGSTWDELKVLYDGIKSAGGIAYAPSATEDWVQFEFPVEHVVDSIFVWSSAEAHAYVAYSRDGITWVYLEEAAGVFAEAADQADARANYWTMAVGKNIRLFPSHIAGRYFKLFILDGESTTIREMFFHREVVAELVRSGVLVSFNWGASAGSEFDLDDGTFKLGGASNPRLSWDGATLEVGGHDVESLTRIMNEFHEYFEDASGDTLDNWQEVASSGGEVSIVSSGGEAGGKFLRIGNNSGVDDAYLVWKHSIPFDPQKLYRVRARARRTYGTGTLYIGVAGRNGADNAWVAHDGSDDFDVAYFPAACAADPGSSWTEYVGFFKGHTNPGTWAAAPNPAAPATLHTDAKYFRPALAANWDGATGITEIDEISIDVLSEETGAIVTEGYIAVKTSAGVQDAGLAGGGTGSQVRIWAGDTYANRAIAPVRIFNDGDFHLGSASKYVDWDGSTLAVRGNLHCDDLVAGTITTAQIGANAVSDYDSDYVETPGSIATGSWQTIASVACTTVGNPVLILFKFWCALGSAGDSCKARILVGTTPVIWPEVGDFEFGDPSVYMEGWASQWVMHVAAAASYVYNLQFRAYVTAYAYVYKVSMALINMKR